MHAPTTAELLAHPLVQAALEEAWIDSLPQDAARRHEEGGWVYMDTTTGTILIQRALVGSRAGLDVSTPPVLAGCVVVATFHTHPNPIAEGWEPGPSAADSLSADLLGVPCIIRAEDGIHSTGPDSRRGGLTGNPGFPA